MQVIDFSKKDNTIIEKVWEQLQNWDYASVTPKCVMDAFYREGISYHDAIKLARRFNEIKNFQKPRNNFCFPEVDWDALFL